MENRQFHTVDSDCTQRFFGTPSLGTSAQGNDLRTCVDKIFLDGLVTQTQTQ
jgi:hypothetical protein